jgi:ribulose-5-phosphate 4-epimerase/fuculose-1-phosphate aldolase
MFCVVSKVLHNKSVNAIPFSCIHKLFQSSNYEIEDYFYDEGIAQKDAFRL